jgi:1-acyl-sn-glycerol-3-phosphate acyltransferase
MVNRIVSVLFLIFIGASSALFFPIALLLWLTTRWIDPRLVLLHQFTSFWACLYLWTMPGWSVTVRGRETLKNFSTAVLVSNHQSQLDILVAFHLFHPFKWVSKAEVFRLPFIGWNMGLNGYIKLKRGDKDSIRKMMSACEAAVSRGCSVFFFPEGTRSRTGRLRPFKPGAFILAQKMRVPIVAIAINGTRRALPKYSLNFHGRQSMQIEVIAAIPYQDFADMTPEEIADRVRRQIGARVTEHRRGEPDRI